MTTESPGPVRMHGLLFDVAGASAQGPRAENQDAFAVGTFPSLGIVAVADWMGGERAGRMAADTALAAVAQGGPIRSVDAARYAVRAADEAVARAAGESPEERQGMGCALALMALTADRAGDLGWVAANVGDVRVLSRSPDGMVRLETRDHTPAFALWEAGEVALDEIPDTPGANRLQRAVGRGGEADARWIPVRAGWTYLLVSDGVTKAMRLDELGEAMALASAAAACDAVARKVEERGPDDNYTVVTVRVLADGGDLTQEAPTLPGAAPFRARAEPDAHRGPFNPPDDVTPHRSSGGRAWIAVLAVLALLLSAAALWMTLQRQRGLTDQVARLSAQVDSLRAAQAAAADTTRLPALSTDSPAPAAAPAGADTAPRTP
ncbi:MAG TPA: protein phosphatase 2C domain-containing protein [Longimicrobium sp.]|nr:protein phosphatase 2C domain-containing protein [Longimicrobium sp.]